MLMAREKEIKAMKLRGFAVLASLGEVLPDS